MEKTTIHASVVMITKNEAAHLPRALNALRDFEEIIIVDSQSTDRTREIAASLGASVFIRPFDNFSNQKNHALEKASHPWVFSMDADELPDETLINAMRSMTEKTTAKAGYVVRRRNYHFGRELRWGGQGRDFPIRFFKKEKARFTQPIHEYVKVQGEVGHLSGSLLHESNRSTSEYLTKLSQYSILEAELLKGRGKRITFFDWGVKPVARFLNVYFLKLGFLDGFEGFLFHALSSFHMIVRQCLAIKECR